MIPNTGLRSCINRPAGGLPISLWPTCNPSQAQWSTGHAPSHKLPTTCPAAHHITTPIGFSHICIQSLMSMNARFPSRQYLSLTRTHSGPGSGSHTLIQTHCTLSQSSLSHTQAPVLTVATLATPIPEASLGYTHSHPGHSLTNHRTTEHSHRLALTNPQHTALK